MLIVVQMTIGMDASADSASQDTASKMTSAYLLISLAWEGRRIDRFNTNEIEKFRNENPNILIYHFLSPSLFLHSEEGSERAANSYRLASRPGDLMGLYLHPLKSITDVSGVTFRTEPTFWGNTITQSDCRGECGQAVSICSYNGRELEALLLTSKDILTSNTGRDPKGIMVGGWLACDNVLEAAVRLGFKYDFSGIIPSAVAKPLNNYPLKKLISSTWASRQEEHGTSSPSKYYEGIHGMTSDGAILDYHSADQILGLFTEFSQKVKNDSPRTLIFNLRFHYETASKFLPRLSTALQGIRAIAEQKGITLKSIPYKGKPKHTEGKAHAPSRRSLPLESH